MAWAKCKGCGYKPGDFKHRITIQQLSQVQNDTGGFTTSWANFAVLWSIVTPKHGNERLISERVAAVDTYNIIVRYLPGITEKMRIQFGSKTLQIKSVITVDELNEYISILAIDEGPGT